MYTRPLNTNLQYICKLYIKRFSVWCNILQLVLALLPLNNMEHILSTLRIVLCTCTIDALCRLGTNLSYFQTFRSWIQSSWYNNHVAFARFWSYEWLLRLFSPGKEGGGSGMEEMLGVWWAGRVWQKWRINWIRLEAKIPFVSSGIFTSLVTLSGIFSCRLTVTHLRGLSKRSMSTMLKLKVSVAAHTSKVALFV